MKNQKIEQCRVIAEKLGQDKSIFMSGGIYSQKVFLNEKIAVLLYQDSGNVVMEVRYYINKHPSNELNRPYVAAVYYSKIPKMFVAKPEFEQLYDHIDELITTL